MMIIISSYDGPCTILSPKRNEGKLLMMMIGLTFQTASRPFVSHCFSSLLTVSHHFSPFLVVSHRFPSFITFSHCFSLFLIVSHCFSLSLTASRPHQDHLPPSSPLSPSSLSLPLPAPFHNLLICSLFIAELSPVYCCLVPPELRNSAFQFKG